MRNDTVPARMGRTIGTVGAALALTWPAAQVRAQGAAPQRSVFTKRFSIDWGMFSPDSVTRQRQVGSTWNKIGITYQLIPGYRLRNDRFAPVAYLDLSGQGDDVLGPNREDLHRTISVLHYGVGGRMRISPRFRQNTVYITGGLGVSVLNASIRANHGGIPRALETSDKKLRLGGKFGVGTDVGQSFFMELTFYNLGKIGSTSHDGVALSVGKRL